MTNVATHDFAPRFNTARPDAEVDRRDHSAAQIPSQLAAPAPLVDRALHNPVDKRVTVVPATTPLAPALREAPRNHAELHAFIAERAQTSMAQKGKGLAPHLSLAQQTGSALAVLTAAQTGDTVAPPMPAMEAEARARLQDAINVRAGAREALAAKEAALTKAREVEHEAIVAESRAGLVDAEGGDALARKLVEWAERGGEKPDLAPDAASLDARHERDRARCHAAAARQAVAAIADVVETKRHALEQANDAVKAAAADVVEAVAEDIATEGRKAGAIHRRAETAALALQHMAQQTFGSGPRYALKPETADLAMNYTGHRHNEPQNLVARATTTWTEFQRSLETDANAALG